jgi:prevent-host-death family protein
MALPRRAGEVPAIGVRQLHNRTTEVVREVREAGAEYVVTHQGRPVALLLPVDTERLERAMLEAGKQAAATAWERYARLAAETRERWPPGRRSGEALDDVRR